VNSKIQKCYPFFASLGDVFTQEVIDTWLTSKREREVDAIRLRPHPYEFALYYDV
jgi:glutamine synthetase